VKRVALVVLAAVLVVGCAFEPGDPAEVDARSSEVGTTANRGSQGTTPVTAASAGSAGPSTLAASNQGVQEGSNPEPSPWHTLTPVEPSGGASGAEANGSGAVAGPGPSGGSASTTPYHVFGR
jgi:hypothetical protein